MKKIKTIILVLTSASLSYGVGVPRQSGIGSMAVQMRSRYAADGRLTVEIFEDLWKGYRGTLILDEEKLDIDIQTNKPRVDPSENEEIYGTMKYAELIIIRNRNGTVSVDGEESNSNHDVESLLELIFRLLYAKEDDTSEGDAREIFNILDRIRGSITTNSTAIPIQPLHPQSGQTVFERSFKGSEVGDLLPGASAKKLDAEYTLRLTIDACRWQILLTEGGGQIFRLSSQHPFDRLGLFCIDLDKIPIDMMCAPASSPSKTIIKELRKKHKQKWIAPLFIFWLNTGLVKIDEYQELYQKTLPEGKSSGSSSAGSILRSNYSTSSDNVSRKNRTLDATIIIGDLIAQLFRKRGCKNTLCQIRVFKELSRQVLNIETYPEPGKPPICQITTTDKLPTRPSEDIIASFRRMLRNPKQAKYLGESLHVGVVIQGKKDAHGTGAMSDEAFQWVLEQLWNGVTPENLISEIHRWAQDSSSSQVEASPTRAFEVNVLESLSDLIAGVSLLLFPR
jgi:hypothetical protein